jgi:hypothetical protein
MYTTAQISKQRIIRNRSYKNFDPGLFLNEVRKISWWGVYPECFDCEGAARTLTDKNAAEWRRYRQLRNTATNSLRTEKKHWQANKINQVAHDSSSIWKNLKNWLG